MTWPTPGPIGTSRNWPRCLTAIRPTRWQCSALTGAVKNPARTLPNGDLADYISYFYDQTFTPCYDLTGNANPALAVQVLEQYKDLVDTADDKDTWFAKIKALCPQVGCTPNVKEYKQDPTAFKGHVGDVSTVIRVALTGRTNTPDLHAILALLGQETAQARLNAALAHYKEEYHG